MTPLVSVVVAVKDGEATLADCLRSLAGQSLPRDCFEVVVAVDGRSRDGSEVIALASGARVFVGGAVGVGAVRNEGISNARGRWVAITDSDCVPTRRWLELLLAAVRPADERGERPLGAAGLVLGFRSRMPAARFVDLTGGLNARAHLAHPMFPYPPQASVIYRREALVEVGGYDARFASYEGADLHTRLLRYVGGAFFVDERAIVFHKHRSSWAAYWRQQLWYGQGYAQFAWQYRDEVQWSLRREAAAWARLVPKATVALARQSGDVGLARRGHLVKEAAHRVSSLRTYWSPLERRRWIDPVNSVVSEDTEQVG
jgi:glycosyltransferase involved in cell wall biosynthesis